MRAMTSLLLITMAIAPACGDSKKEGGAKASSNKAAQEEVVALQALHKAQEDYKAKHQTYVPDIKYLMGQNPVIKNFEPESFLDEKLSFAMSIKVDNPNAKGPFTEYVATKPGSNGIFAVDQTGVIKLMVTEGSLDLRDYATLKEAFAAKPAL